MDEDSFRRGRKSKLVPREYSDSDDEIAFMQQELEEELAKLKATSLLKKLHSKTRPTKNLKFSVKVEVEEVDELPPKEEFDVTYDPLPESTGCEQLSIRIDSVRTLCKTEPTPKPKNTTIKGSTTLKKPTKESTTLKGPSTLHANTVFKEPTEVKESTKIIKSSKQKESTYLKESTIHNGPTTLNDNTIFKEPAKVKESTKIAETSKQKDSIILNEPTTLNDKTIFKEPAKVKESTKTAEPSKQKESTYLKEPTKSNEPTTLIDHTIFKEPAEVKESTKLRESNTLKVNNKEKEGKTTNLNESTKLEQQANTAVKHYIISDEVLQKEINEASKKTTLKADKLLEIHMKNFFGREDNDDILSNLDVDLQDVLQEWKVWQDNYPSIRDAPLVYICYMCDIGWWNFYDFREHLKRHNTEINFGVESEVFSHEYVIVAYRYGKPGQHSVTIDDNCWRCEKNLDSHRVNVYTCSGCDRNFMTCLHLAVHQGNCSEYRRMFFDKNGTRFTFLVYVCSVCPWKHWSDEALQQHMIRYHTVRSDMPINWAANPCVRCNQLCTRDKRRCSRVVKDCYYCIFCARKFYSKHDLNIHNMMTPHRFKCRVCHKIVKKACMEADHLLEHTETYTMIFKCILCTVPMYFTEESFAKAHKNNFHRKKAKSIYNCFDKVIVPKSLLAHIQPLEDTKNRARYRRSKSKKNKNALQNTYESASQDLVEFLDNTQPVKEITPQETPVFQTPNTIVFDNNMGVQITILDKRTVQEIMNSTANVQIPDMQDIKQEVLNDENCAGNLEKFFESSKEISQSILGNRNGMYNEIPVIKQEPIDADEDILNSMLHIEDGNLPIKFEIKEEEEEEVFEDDIISLNHSCSSVSNGMVLGSNVCRNRKMSRMEKFQVAAITDKESIRITQDYLKMVHEQAEYFCSKCNHTFVSFNKYLTHFVNHAYNRFACPKCLKQCHDIFDMMRHVNSHIKNSFVCIRAIKPASDSPENGFQCKVCRAVLWVKDFFQHWEEHLDIKYGEERLHEFSVDMDKKPLLKEMLMILMDPERTLKTISDGFERGKKIKKCNSCYMTFDRKNDYKRHFIEHLLSDAHAERQVYGNLRCQICGTGFNKIDGYKRHLRDHGSLPIYKCEICDKSFSDSSNFSKHKKVHNLSVLICDICKKKFNAKHYLIRHLELHEVLKPITCENCNRVFYSKTAFNKHMRNYNKSYKCMQCSEVFGSLRDKWEHQWHVHKERQFKADCPMCGEEFRRYRDVKTHLRDVHNYLAPKKTQYSFVNDEDSS